MLDHPFLEHLFRDQFSVIQGKFYIQRFSCTPFGRTLVATLCVNGVNALE